MVRVWRGHFPALSGIYTTKMTGEATDPSTNKIAVMEVSA
jgi:hypothetical protein